MNELALFAGAGGGILGGKLLGWRTICAVEWEPYAASVLAARQNDGVLPPFPIWDDVQSFDGRSWRGIVDVVSGGFPCQDISVAGKGAGIDGARSGMWGHMARIVGEVQPRYVFVENSPALLTRGLGRVLGDLAALGYDCRWTVLGAADVGAPHQRDRFWLVAHATDQGFHQRRGFDGVGKDVRQLRGNEPDGVSGGRQEKAAVLAHANSLRQPQPQGSQPNQWGRVGDCGLSDACSAHVERQRHESERAGAQFSDIGNASWWQSEPDVGRVANGVAARVDRLKAIGNGQVPLCAAIAWRLLTGEK